MSSRSPSPKRRSPSPKRKRRSGPKKTASHPSYASMIRQAISALKDRKGSSRQAIQKYIFANFKVGGPATAAAQLRMALRRGVKSGALKQTSGTGAAGRFRNGPPPKVKKAKKPKRAKKAKKPKKKAAAKKPKKARKSKAKKAKKSPKKAARKPSKKAARKPAKKAAKPKRAAKSRKSGKKSRK